MKAFILPALVVLGLGIWVYLTRIRSSSTSTSAPSTPTTNSWGNSGPVVWMKTQFANHWAHVVLLFVGLWVTNMILAITPPFKGIYADLKTSESFWPLNILAFAIGMLKIFGTRGDWLAGKLKGVAFVAVGYFMLQFATSNWSSWKKESPPATQTAGSPVAQSATFAGNARDNWNGPDKEFVMNFWQDDSTMSDIAAAESRFNQYSDSTVRTCDGVLRHKNSNGTEDLGVMQINSSHKEEAEKLGLNLCTLEGNLKYARLLKDREGYTPWNSSRFAWRDHCLEKAGCTGTTILADAGGDSQFASTTGEMLDMQIKVPADGKVSETIFVGGRDYKLWFSNPGTKRDLLAVKNGTTEILMKKDTPVYLGADLERIAFKAIDGDSLVMYVCRVRGTRPPAGSKCVM